jgi:hypothetical protein
MAQIEVNYYGVHWAPGDVAFLLQARGDTNAWGLKAPNPFTVRTKRRWTVNHLFALNAVNPARTHLDAFRAILENNSAARFLLPLPKDGSLETPGGVAVLQAADIESAIDRSLLLLKMSSPIRLPVMRANLANPKTVLDELEMTNTQPLVLAGVDIHTMAWAREIAQQANLNLPRRLMIIATPEVPMKGIPRVEMDDMLLRHPRDLAILPWENLGNITLRAYMRREWDGNWFTREPVPGNEHKMREPYKPPE